MIVSTYFFYFTIAYIIVFVIAEIIKRFTNIHADHSRKIIHVCSSGITCFLPIYLSQFEIVLMAAFFITFLSFSHLTRLLHALHKVNRVTWGEVWFPVAAGLCALLFLPENERAFQFGFFVLGVSDTLAEYAGKYLKSKIVLQYNSKTIAGLLAFIISAFVAGIVFKLNFNPGICAAIILLGFIELVSTKGIDNLLVPLAAGGIVLLSTV